MTLNSATFSSFSHDEVHAWNIAANFNFFEIIRLMKAEGHTFIWYLLIKPFAYLDIIMGMKYLNWAFCLGALAVLWRWAPFSTIVKILICFSFPFVRIYPVVARCYSIGILCLFLLAALYPKRLKHPFLFSGLIFIAANTSLMAAVGAGALGLILIYDLLKSQKVSLRKFSVWGPAAILGLTGGSLFIQWFPPALPTYTRLNRFNEAMQFFLFQNFHHPFISYAVWLLVPLMLISALCIFKKRALFFWIVSSGGLLLFFKYVYAFPKADYHFFFFYIYLLLAFWINASEYKNPSVSGNTKKEQVLHVAKIVFIGCFSLLSLLSLDKDVKGYWYLSYNVKNDFPEYLSAHFSGSTVYADVYHYDWLLPFVKDIDFRSYDGKKLVSFDNYFHNYLDIPIPPTVEELRKTAPENSYILMTNRNLKYPIYWDIDVVKIK